MSLAFLAGLAFAQQPVSMTFAWGDSGGGKRPLYAVSDTFLSSAEPHRNFGKDPLLEGGPGKVILIRFDDLRQRLGSMKLTSASLMLTKVEGSDFSLLGVAGLNSPWVEGGDRRNFATMGFTRPGAPRVESGATWSSRWGGASPAAWQAPGAGGPSDASGLKGLTILDEGPVVTLDGLAETLNDPRAWGIALRFAKPVSFVSSNGRTGKPRLTLSVGGGQTDGANLAIDQVDAPAGELRVTVRNLSDRATTGRVTAWIDGRAQNEMNLPAIKPGETASVRMATASLNVSQRVFLRVEPEGDDTDWSDNTLEFRGDPKPLNAPLAMIQYANTTMFPRSQFSFAPDGALASFVPSSNGPKWDPASGLAGLRAALALPNWNAMVRSTLLGTDHSGPTDVFPGLAGGDSRDDTEVSPLMSIPYDFAQSNLIDGAYMPATELLSATDVAVLNSRLPWTKLMPQSIAVKILAEGGAPLGNTKVEIFGIGAEGKPDQVTVTTSSGLVSLDPAAFAAAGCLEIRARTSDGLRSGVVKAWQAVDSVQRSGGTLAILTVATRRVLLPEMLGEDLAADRLVLDSAGSRPAELASLVDGNPQTALDVSPGQWVEIDLSRDRTISAVELQIDDSSTATSVQISGRNTGMRASEATSLASLTPVVWWARNFGTSRDGRSAVLIPLATQTTRTVRISPTGGTLRLAGVRLLPLAPTR
ncbi:MAG: hypothetical protein JNM85_03930 [Chthonomonas sp.]|nr:hypothetical protein [Chthonomonas sp.]